MTNDTAITEQARAVFLAALMVLSVMVGTVALSGGAAAATSFDVTLAENDVDETTTYTVELTTSAEGTANTIDLDLGGASGVEASNVALSTSDGTSLTGSDLSVQNTDVDDDAETDGEFRISLDSSLEVSQGETITIEITDVTNPGAGDYDTLMELHNSDGTGSSFDSSTQTITIVNSVPAISDFDASVDSGTVNVSFVSNQTLDASSIAVEFTDSEESLVHTLDITYNEESLENGDVLYYAEWSPTDSQNGEHTATLTTAADADGNNDAADGQADEVTVDTQGPVFDTVDPVDGANEKSVPDTIEVGVNDSLSEIQSDSITVTLTSTGSGDYTFVDSVDVTSEGDGISFAYDEGDQTAGTVTITPDELPIQSFPDGDIEVDVSASDAAGNTNTTAGNFDTVSGASTTYDFNLDTGASFEFTFEEDGDDDGEVLTIDSTQSINVDVANDGLGTANLTISNSSESWTFQNDDTDAVDQTSDDVWDNANGKFTVVPGDGNAVPELTDGTYTITVNATDTHGNVEPDETYTLEVDTQAPKFESVTVTGDGDDDIFNNSEAETVKIEATFNESVTSATVDIDVDGDGNFEETDVSLDDVATDGMSASTTYDLTGHTVDTETASVNASLVTDIATNQNTTPVGSDSGGIDTDVPTPTNSLGDGSTLDSYFNLTQTVDVSAPSDAESVEYYIAEQDSEAYTKIEDPDHFDSSAYDDGVYKISVNVTDDAGNMGSDAAENLVINLEEPVVTTGLSDGDRVSGEITLSESVEVVNNDSSVEYTYEVDTGSGFSAVTGGVSVSPDTEVTFDTSSFGAADSQTLPVKVTATETGGAGESVSTTVDLVVDEVHVTRTTLTQNGEDLQVGVTTDEEVDELEVELNSTDNFHSQVSETLTLEEFGDATETESGDFQYVYDVSDVRDGAYSMNVSAAANGSHVSFEDLDAAYEEEGAELDNSNATVVDADVVGADETSMTVQVEFSEPVSAIGSFDDFNGATVINHDVGTDGIVNVTLDEEVQINGTTELSANSVTEQYGDDSTESTSGDVSFELQFSEGINVFSIPAETGSISLDESPFNHDAVEGVFTYEGDGEWASYDPNAKENSLTELEGGNAYVVNAKKGADVDLNIENVPSDADDQPIQSQHVSAGWNLIGHYQEGSQSVAQALAPLDDRTYSVQEGYTGTQVDTLESGEGYWLFVDESGIHAPVDYSGMNSEQPIIHNFDVSSSGQDVEVSFTTDEPLNEIQVSGTDDLDGTTLTEDDFIRTDSSGTYTYTADLSSGSDGTFGAVLVTAKDAAGNDGAAEESDSVMVDTSAPDAPTSVSATAVSGGDIEVSFDDVDESGSGVTSYSVKRATSTGPEYTEVGTVTDDDSTSYTFTDTSASDGMQYYYVVTAIDNSGKESSTSSEVTATSDATSASMVDAEDNAGTNDPATNTLTLHFSEGVSTTDDSGLTSEDLSFVDANSGTGSALTVDSVTHSGGDSTATVTLSGSDYEAGADAIQLDSNVVDDAGNQLDSGASVTIDNDDTQ